MLVIREVQEKPIDPGQWPRLAGRVGQEMVGVAQSSPQMIRPGVTGEVADFLLKLARRGWGVADLGPESDHVVFATWRDAVWHACRNLGAPPARPTTVDLTLCELSYAMVQQGRMIGFLEAFFEEVLRAPELCTGTLKVDMVQIASEHASLIEQAAAAARSSAPTVVRPSPKATQKFLLLAELYTCIAKHIRNLAPTITPSAWKGAAGAWVAWWKAVAARLEGKARELLSRTTLAERYGLA
jgi:hypothetical protein